MDRNEGFSSNCPHVGGGNGIDLETCKTQAREAGANVFNFRDDACYFKSCEDPSDLQPSTEYGGLDVYVNTCSEGECFHLSTGWIRGTLT